MATIRQGNKVHQSLYDPLKLKRLAENRKVVKKDSAGCNLATQWKRGRTRFKELRKRGVSQELAAKTAGSAHGPWRIAKSPALHVALPNAYLASLELPAMIARS